MYKSKGNKALNAVAYATYRKVSCVSVVTSLAEFASPRISKNKFCRHEQIDEKSQAALDEHVARSFEGIAGNNCVLKMSCLPSTMAMTRTARWTRT